MPQFALEFEIDNSKGDNLSASLNGLLMDKPTWKVVTIHTIVMNKAKLHPPQPVMIATVVFDSPVEDMLPVDKDYLEVEK
jgi:hypothetical protein